MKSKSLLLMLMLLAISFSAYAEEWDIYDLTNSGIPADDVYAVLTAPDNTKWVGTFSGGLASYDDESWQYYYNDYATIRCIAREDNGNIWIGTGSGAAVFDGSNWTEYSYGQTPIPYPVVTEITIDGDNVKWLGTGFGGIASFDGSDWNIFDTGNSGLPDNMIYTINIDRDDVKWIGTQWGGLTSYNGSEWVSYNTENSEIPDDTVYDIQFDNEDSIWMATYGGGVACFDGDNWTVYNVDNSGLPSNFTQELLIDDQGNIWVGTEEGLAKFDGETWYSYNSTNSGLPADNVLSLALDAESRLWIGTYEGGLCCYQESDFGSVAGTVTDAETGEAIAGAVFSDGYFSLAETAADGSFSFEKIPGIYEVTLTKDGYNALTIPDVEILADEMTTLDITLLAETMEIPSAPTDVTAIPAASGIFQAEIAWTCPATTIGGATLTDLDEMRVYRDGTLIFTDNSPAIGAPGSHMDFSMLTAGTYTYGVVGFNDAGEGITVENTIWVGEDVPAAVDNLVLVQTTPGVLSGTLTWDNPTTGLHGGACNNTISGYHIARNDGVLFEVTGSATSFIDDTIPQVGTYCYTVTAYNLIGDGGSATSNIVLISESGVLILEDFSGGVPPAGWYIDGFGQTNWESSIDNYAGGTGMEMMFGWTPPFYGSSRMCTMAMDTSNMEALTLEFMHSVDDYSGGYTLGVATSSDGITWNAAWSIVPAGMVGPESVNVNITTTDVGSAAFQMCFYLNGDSYGINYWYIDDVLLTSGGIPALDPPVNLAVDQYGLFTWDAPAGNRELESYNVYLDDVMAGNTDATEWMFSDLTDDQDYTAGLEAVYDDGVSELVTLDFTFNPLAVLDPPTNLAVDEETGLFTWDAPEAGGEIEELIYDNGAANGQYSYVGYSMGTHMSPAEACQILELKIHTYSGTEFNAEVWGWDAGAPTEDLLHTQSANALWSDWVIVDISDANLMVDSDFVVAFGSINEYTYMSCNTNLNNGRSWDHDDTGGWTTWPEAYLIRAVVQYGNGRIAELSPTPVNSVGAHALVQREKVSADVINHNVDTSRELESYNVYLDDVMVGNTADIQWMFSDLTGGQTYTAGLEAIYDNGVSGLVTIDFTYDPTTTFDPPVNLAVDEDTGLISWDAPGGGGGEIEELIYDNGATNGQFSYVGYSMGTHMSPAEACQILELKIHTSSGSDFNAEVWGWDAGAPTEDLLHTETAYALVNDWVTVDISEANLMVNSDFVVAFGSINEYTYMSCNYNLNNGRSWDHDDAGGWTTWPEAYLIRAVVQYGNGRIAELSPIPVKKVAAHALAPGEKVFADVINHNVNTSRELESYNVYLDNEYITQTTDLFYQFTGLEFNSSYLAGVSAQYTNGESETVTVEFVYTGDPTYGDVDDNGIVEAFDASLTLQYVVGMDPAPSAPLPWEEWRITVADVDGNGSVEAFDSALILQFVVGMINDFPVEGVSRFNPVTAGVVIEAIDDCLYFTAQDNLLSFELEINSHKEFLQTPEFLIPDAISAFNAADYKFASASAQYIEGTFLKIPLQRNQDNELPQNISLTLKINYDTQTSIIDLTCLNGDTGQLPEVSALLGNMPNPFNPETNIRFSIKAGETGILSIYNAKGQLMQEKKFTEGSHDYIWKANNRASGVYLYRLHTPSYTQTRKMLLLK
ncbi:MAG: carboxypeptidase regulatory-like domain-containing protein [Candidatus Cloacimonetes bacterium]|nr:carboxypeptidase regulatory-like domain-containing protein [Candidatus Cloacimonadota bacterium]